MNVNGNDGGGADGMFALPGVSVGFGSDEYFGSTDAGWKPALPGVSVGF